MRPRLRLAITDGALCWTASLSRWTHQVGEADGTHSNDTPTSNAIDLSSPATLDVRLAMAS